MVHILVQSNPQFEIDTMCTTNEITVQHHFRCILILWFFM